MAWWWAVCSRLPWKQMAQKGDRMRGNSRYPCVARKGHQLASMAIPVLISPRGQRGSGDSFAVSLLSSILQAGEGYSPTLFLPALTFGTPDNRTPPRHGLKTTLSRHPGWGGCCLSGWGQLAGASLHTFSASLAGVFPLGLVRPTGCGRALWSSSLLPLTVGRPL